MREQLSQLADEIKNQGLAPIDEATTKQIIILRLLSILGWNTYNPNEVIPEYSAGDKRVDYSLRINRQNRVFIEVKRVGEDLELHQEQLLSYAFQEGIELAILTDGVSWWFYLPLRPGSWEQRKFFTIDIAQQSKDEVVANFTNFLSRENISSGKAIEFAESVYKSRQKKSIIKETLPKAWNKIISETDEILIDLINEVTEKLCGFKAPNEEVAKFISEHRVQLTVGEGLLTPVVRKMDRQKVYTRTKRDAFGGYTRKRLVSFNFAGKTYSARSWRDMLLEICKKLYEVHPKDFQKLLSLRGTKKPYFTHNPNELRDPIRVEGTDVFVETNLGASSIVTLCRKTLSIFGYGADSLRVETE